MWRANPRRGTVLAAAALLACVSFCGAASAADTVNLTGRWACDDGGTYYIRQNGNQVWWLGQSGNGGADWTNVLHGGIRGDAVVGDWSDVPAGAALNSGTLTLELVFRHGRVVEIRKRKQVGDGFGGGVWTRAD